MVSHAEQNVSVSSEAQLGAAAPLSVATMPDQAAPVPANWDRSGLPYWAFHSEELTNIEKDVLFRRHWQIACHVSDVPNPGDFTTFDMCGDRAVVMRGADGVVRAFHNLCRHRGSRVLAEESGTCKRVISCPFHGWSYNLDGTLRSAAMPDSLPDLDKKEFGLKPIELEIWMGFVFLRFLPGPQPSVAELLAHHAPEVALYGSEQMVPESDKVWSHKMAVNWKAVRDVDNEGYHVPMAHPGLMEIYGQNYFDEPTTNGTSRSFGMFSENPGRLWSVRNYKKFLPVYDNLPETHQRAWLYIGIFPNMVLTLYPETVGFYQEYPLSKDLTIQRGQTYHHANESREARAARYLATRIDRETTREDTQLILWTCEAMESTAYEGIILSDHEYGVRRYHDALREKLPILNQHEAPEPGTIAETNAALLAAGG